MIKWLVPIIFFALVINVTLILCLMDVKYTFEPALLGKSEDFLLDEIYRIIYLFYWVSNVAFFVIYSGSSFFYAEKTKSRTDINEKH